MNTKRKSFIASLIGIAMIPVLFYAFTFAPIEANKEFTPFQQVELKYDFGALEPHIDAQTMELHYSKHHAGYTRKFNAALESHELKGNELKDVFAKITASEKDKGLRNNGGGYYNHNLYWEVLTPGGATNPSGELAKAIEIDFGSYESFVKAFVNAGATQFGSGWAWLSVDEKGKLFISQTPNQDNPMMKNLVSKSGTPILAVDVWEHAYYLNYQNKRKSYIDAFVTCINWDVVGENYKKIVGN